MRIAWRNLWRNRRRTALALAAIGLSVTLVLAYTSILRAYGDWMVETITGPDARPRAGARAAVAEGPRDGSDAATTSTRRSSRLRRDPDVAGATARVYAPALAAREEEGFAVVVIGVDTPRRIRSGAAARRDVVEPLARAAGAHRAAARRADGRRGRRRNRGRRARASTARSPTTCSR